MNRMETEGLARTELFLSYWKRDAGRQLSRTILEFASRIAAAQAHSKLIAQHRPWTFAAYECAHRSTFDGSIIATVFKSIMGLSSCRSSLLRTYNKSHPRVPSHK
jgi:hypothetical protein